MSYEEAQLEVAKKYDFDKWDECISEAYMNNEFRVMYDTDPHKLFMEVAEIYANAKAEAKWNEVKKEQLVDFHIGVMKLGLIAEGDKKWHECYESPIRRIAEKYYDESFKPEFKP